MTKGVIRGGLLGLLLGGVGLGAASFLAPQPAGNLPPSEPQITAPVSAEVDVPDTDVPEAAVQPSEDITIAAAPTVSEPAVDVTPPENDTAPLELPTAEAVGVDLETPVEGASPNVTASAETPVLPNPQSVAPQVPANEEDVQVETTTPDPVQVTEDTSPDTAGDDPETPVIVDDSEAVADVETDSPDADTVETGDEEILAFAPEVDVESPSPVSTPQEDAVVVAPEAETPTPSPQAPAAPLPPNTANLPNADTSVAEPSSEQDAQDEESRVADEPVSEDSEDPVVSVLPTGAGTVKINRGFSSDEAEVEPEVESGEAPVDMSDGPALDLYATASDSTFDKPLMSLILIDNGKMEAAPRAVLEIPFPVTVIIDGTREDATARMEAFRAEGIEVAAMLELPTGALPSDVEVAMQATFRALPETVAFVDLGGASRPATDQILQSLFVDGRGFVSADNGLSTGLRAARSANVPAAQVYRDIDGAGQDARAIRRFLDQAAFRARQSDGVVVMGRIEAETLSALVLWGSANRAGQVDLVPLSAILRRDRENQG